MKKIPNLKGLSVEEAKDLLRKKSLKFIEETKKIFSLTIGSGKIVKTEEIDNKIVLYESNRKLFLPIILGTITVTTALALGLTYGNGIYKSIKDQIIEITGIITAPELETEEGWGKERTVKVIRDARGSKEIKFYEYCVRKNRSDECEWKETYTKNAVISKTGTWHVIFRGVDADGKRGRESTILVYVDNEAPVINNFDIVLEDETSIKVKSSTSDKDSGLDKIMYSLDGKNYEEGKDEYTFKNLVPGEEYTLYLKAVDNVGNEKISTIKIVKKTKEEIEAEQNKEETKEETKEEKEWDTPQIDLKKLPSVFEYGEKYDLPSHYDFGNDEGKVVCKVDGIEEKDTENLPVGKHEVKCTATSNHGKETNIEKEILIQAPVGEDEVLDGWIKLNLYYPEDSYNWEWRYGLSEDEDEEYKETGWQEYTGPILVKIEDTSKIYIRYELNGEPQITAPTGQVLVDIEPTLEKVVCGGETQVSIIFDQEALTKQYRINGGKWQDYQGPFPVNGNTLIEARATKNEDVYNTEGELEYTKLLEGYDKREVKEEQCKEVQDPAINLNGIPSIVYMGENISLPSYYTYGSHEAGKVECTDQNGNKVVNTRFLTEGNYKVTCNLETADGIKKGPVSRSFTIERREQAPEVSLWELPSRIVKGDNYKLPSYYTYGSHGTGLVTCQDELSNVITNTSELELGDHIVTCILTAEDGKQAVDSRNIKVSIGFEPYIDLNNLQSTIYKGDFYSLPGTYNYGRPNSGVKECRVNGEVLTDTHSLDVGTYDIFCSITNLAGQTATASRTINVVKRPIVPEVEILSGPVIISNPIDGITTEEAIITITPQEEASVIKYSYDQYNWNTYKEPFMLYENKMIYAYYIRKSDGKQSKVSKYYVRNIKERNLPYVRIDANPGYEVKEGTNVEVTISGSDYDTLEYSYDGVVYYPYTGPLLITQSKTVYAKGTNGYGSTKESVTIKTTTPPVIPDKLDVAIALNPDGTQGYIVNETEVIINYDSKAEHKYYRTSSSAEWQEYTGPFKVRQNTTVYAYAISKNGQGNTEKSIDFLVLGISDPIISIDKNPPLRAHSVKVHITWDKNAKVKKYRIINEDGTVTDWMDWEDDIEIDENCTVEAYQEDSIGNTSKQVEYKITNIVPEPSYTSVAKEDYYLIKLNYPSTSEANSREYKWKNDGIWKKYDQKGILLIKQNKVDKYNLEADGVEIEDENGNKVTIDIAHVYVLDVPLSELSENLFIRWDNTKPASPTINFNTENVTTEVEVSISYAKVIVEKEYKIIYSDGTDSGWQEYTGPFKVNKNNTTIYARGKNRLEIYSETVDRTITNIDEVAPTITLTGDLETPKQVVNLTVTANDDKMLYMVKWARGKKNTDYFNENKDDQGTSIKNGSTIQLEENGNYTFYAVDQAGNEVVEQIQVTNIDLTAPDITITVLTSGITTQARISIDYGDSTTKEYSIGDNSSYQEYTDTLTLSSYDYYQLANPDGSLTIYAKGQDSAGNIQEVSEVIRCLDLDKPDEPTINLHMDYPTLSKDGFTTNNYVEVTYASRNDITNEISLDNGETWTRYIGPVEVEVPTTVKARSKKTVSGFTTEVEKTVNPVEGALIEAAYDEDNSTSQELGASGKATFYIVNDGLSKKIAIRSSATTGSVVNVYGTNGALNKTVDIDGGNLQVTLASGTTKVEIVAGSSGLDVTEIKLNGVISSVEGTSILGIMQDNNLNAGYYNFKVGDDIYPVHLIVENRNTITADTTYGDVFDVGTSNSYAENMVIVKHTGDLTINEGVTVAPYSTENGGPKGFFLYVTGKLTNNGTIDNSHGAYAQGQDVKLWQNANGSYEYIPAEGGAGGVGRQVASGNGLGNSGTAGTEVVQAGTVRATGGGAAGGYSSTGKPGAGAAGTSYSGGTGGGSAHEVTSFAGDPNGGPGGDAKKVGYGTGGTGNPGGDGNLVGTNGTGGLLIIYADGYENNGTITVAGTAGACSSDSSNRYHCGGASGGGSINIFTNQSTGVNSLGIVINDKYNDFLGTVSSQGGVNTWNTATSSGGAGTTNIGEIRNGTYYDLKTIIEQDIDEFARNLTKEGDSILSILQNNNLSAGYYIFKVGDIKYSVHLVEETEHTISTAKTYGDLADCASGVEETKMAKNLVIVKVNGDLTITDTGSVGPVYNENYGGPKGFMLYVTGTLTNNGTIDNSHGAYAEGEDVRLWQNTDGSYVIVPALGASGGTGRQVASGNSLGNSGTAGTEVVQAGTVRATGGGAAGGYSATGKPGAGSAGTSYSGGTGGASAHEVTSGDGNSNGGAGGDANLKFGPGTGGTGNPGGTGKINGASGTGGLLIIYANGYINDGMISANGTAGNCDTNITYHCGGGSGGGSINIFTNQSTGIDGFGVVTQTRYEEILGDTSVVGGTNILGKITAAGGNGTVNIGEIRNGNYYDLTIAIDQDKETFELSRVITGDSILSILQNNGDLSTGYYIFKANGERYPVHLIEETDSIISSDKTYGSIDDVSDGTNPAYSMVIVKRNGNLTINEGVTVGPYFNENGGPKGFFLYVTGKLTNNGTIDNSHGAIAAGQDVYLYKNGDNSYEYVPAVGGIAPDGTTSGGDRGIDGSNGQSGTNRRTGSGGGGANVNSSYSSSTTLGGKASDGTSYSGGAGGGGGNHKWGEDNGNANAQTGGSCYGINTGNYCQTGVGIKTGVVAGSGWVQTNLGTGGLLIIYTDTFENNGTISANGTSPAPTTNTYVAYGGASGGGSVNIFYTNSIVNTGTVTAAGGVGLTNGYGNARKAKSGSGGEGSVTYTQINPLSPAELHQVQNVLSANTISETISRNANIPEISQENTENGRMITIEVENDNKTEYSLDLGNTWLEYTEPFEVLENTTIFTRVVDNDNKVLGSSTYTITTIEKKIDKQEEENILPPESTPNIVEDSQEEENPKGSDADE